MKCHWGLGDGPGNRPLIYLSLGTEEEKISIWSKTHVSMMIKLRDPIVLLGLALLPGLLLTACGDSTPKDPSPRQSESAVMRPARSSTPGQWVDKKWNGREGAFLLLSKNNDSYVVLITSKTGPATYKGVAAGDQIEFNRDGVLEAIRSTSGRETGIESLMKNKECLTIREGEG